MNPSRQYFPALLASSAENPSSHFVVKSGGFQRIHCYENKDKSETAGGKIGRAGLSQKIQREPEKRLAVFICGACNLESGLAFRRQLPFNWRPGCAGMSISSPTFLRHTGSVLLF